jgi:hypothetical protein
VARAMELLVTNRIFITWPCEHCGQSRNWVVVGGKPYGVHACERIPGMRASGLCEAAPGWDKR